MLYFPLKSLNPQKFNTLAWRFIRTVSLAKALHSMAIGSSTHFPQGLGGSWVLKKKNEARSEKKNGDKCYLE